MTYTEEEMASFDSIRWGRIEIPDEAPYPKITVRREPPEIVVRNKNIKISYDCKGSQEKVGAINHKLKINIEDKIGRKVSANIDLWYGLYNDCIIFASDDNGNKIEIVLKNYYK